MSSSSSSSSWRWAGLRSSSWQHAASLPHSDGGGGGGGARSHARSLKTSSAAAASSARVRLALLVGALLLAYAGVSAWQRRPTRDDAVSSLSGAAERLWQASSSIAASSSSSSSLSSSSSSSVAATSSSSASTSAASPPPPPPPPPPPTPPPPPLSSLSSSSVTSSPLPPASAWTEAFELAARDTVSLPSYLEFIRRSNAPLSSSPPSSLSSSSSSSSSSSNAIDNPQLFGDEHRRDDGRPTALLLRNPSYDELHRVVERFDARRIPPIVHLIWLERRDEPANGRRRWQFRNRLWLSACRATNCDVVYVAWTRRGLFALAPRFMQRSLIATMDEDVTLRGLGDKRALSDMIRLELLHLFGGVYIDTDVLCLRPLSPLLRTLPADAFVLGHENSALTGNSWFGAPRAHRVVIELAARAAARLDANCTRPPISRGSFGEQPPTSVRRRAPRDSYRLYAYDTPWCTGPGLFADTLATMRHGVDYVDLDKWAAYCMFVTSEQTHYEATREHLERIARGDTSGTRATLPGEAVAHNRSYCFVAHSGGNLGGTVERERELAARFAPFAYGVSRTVLADTGENRSAAFADRSSPIADVSLEQLDSLVASVRVCARTIDHDEALTHTARVALSHATEATARPYAPDLRRRWRWFGSANRLIDDPLPDDGAAPL